MCSLTLQFLTTFNSGFHVYRQQKYSEHKLKLLTCSHCGQNHAEEPESVCEWCKCHCAKDITSFWSKKKKCSAWSPPECCCNHYMVTTLINFRFHPLLIIGALGQVLNVAILSVFHTSTNSSSCCLARHALSYGPVFILKPPECLVDFYLVSQQPV